MSQASRMLRLLRDSGPVGVHSFTLRRDHYIANPSARVQDLEAQGHVITATPEKLHGRATGMRYRLVHAAAARPLSMPPPVPDAPTSSPARLFESPEKPYTSTDPYRTEAA